MVFDVSSLPFYEALSYTLLVDMTKDLEPSVYLKKKFFIKRERKKKLLTFLCEFSNLHLFRLIFDNFHSKIFKRGERTHHLSMHPFCPSLYASNFSKKILKGNLKDVLFFKNSGLTTQNLLSDGYETRNLCKSLLFMQCNAIIFTQFQVIIFIKRIEFIQIIFNSNERVLKK